MRFYICGDWIDGWIWIPDKEEDNKEEP